jgi:cell division protein FtsQ
VWDNPRLLNLAAGFLVGLALLALAASGIALLYRSAWFPLRAIELTSEPKHTTRAEIEAAIHGRIRGNFFALAPAEVRAGLEELPWVRRATVRRVWPDRLEVVLEEHVALARWGERSLVNTHGERFNGRSDARLPWFLGPAGSEAEMARRYTRFAAVLAPLGTALERVVLTPRFAWQLRLANGMHIMLGRDADEAEARLQRFVGVYPSIEKRHQYVDLRYPNGFALRVRELKG